MLNKNNFIYYILTLLFKRLGSLDTGFYYLKTFRSEDMCLLELCWKNVWCPHINFVRISLDFFICVFEIDELDQIMRKGPLKAPKLMGTPCIWFKRICPVLFYGCIYLLVVESLVKTKRSTLTHNHTFQDLGHPQHL